MEYESTTTLNNIREGSPESGRACAEGWAKLLAYVGKTKGDDEPIDLITVLDSNGLDDALWVLSYGMGDGSDRLARHLQAWCAEQVLHLFEAEHPDDRRVSEQIDMLRNDYATEGERAAEWDAAVASAWSAAGAAGSGAQAARAAVMDAREGQLRKMLGK